MGSRFLPYVIRVVKTHIPNFALFQRKIRELGLVQGLTNQIAGKLRKFPCTSDYAYLCAGVLFGVIFLFLDCYGSSDRLFYILAWRALPRLHGHLRESSKRRWNECARDAQDLTPPLPPQHPSLPEPTTSGTAGEYSETPMYCWSE